MEKNGGKKKQRSKSNSTKHHVRSAQLEAPSRSVTFANRQTSKGGAKRAAKRGKSAMEKGTTTPTPATMRSSHTH